MLYPYLGINFLAWIYATCLLIGTIALWVTEYFFGAGIIPPEVWLARNVLYVLFIPFLLLTYFSFSVRLLSFLLKHLLALVLAFVACMALLFHTELLVVTSLAAYGSDTLALQHYTVHPCVFVILCALGGAAVYALCWIAMRISQGQNRRLNRWVKIAQVPALYVIYMLFVPAFLGLLKPTLASLSQQQFVTCFVGAVGLIVNFIWFERTRDVQRRKILGWFMILLCIAYALWILNPLHCEWIAPCPVCYQLLLCRHMI